MGFWLTHTCTRSQTCIGSCLFTHVYTLTPVQTCTLTHVHMLTPLHTVHTLTPVHICALLYLFTHAHTHTFYTHTQRFLKRQTTLHQLPDMAFIGFIKSLRFASIANTCQELSAQGYLTTHLSPLALLSVSLHGYPFTSPGCSLHLILHVL